MHTCTRNPRLWKLSGRDNRKQQECGESVWESFCADVMLDWRRGSGSMWSLWRALYTNISPCLRMARNVETLCLIDGIQFLIYDIGLFLFFFFLPSSRYQIERTCQGALGCWKTDYSNECFDFYLVSSFPSVVLQGVLDKLYSAGDPSDVDLKVT